MPDETMIFGVSEEGPNGDALGFIDLTKLHVGNKVHDAYRAAVLEAAQQRRLSLIHISEPTRPY